jgi:hypothetical protein
VAAGARDRVLEKSACSLKEFRFQQLLRSKLVRDGQHVRKHRYSENTVTAKTPLNGAESDSEISIIQTSKH